MRKDVLTEAFSDLSNRIAERHGYKLRVRTRDAEYAIAFDEGTNMFKAMKVAEIGNDGRTEIWDEGAVVIGKTLTLEIGRPMTLGKFLTNPVEAIKL